MKIPECLGQMAGFLFASNNDRRIKGKKYEGSDRRETTGAMLRSAA
jgi:hypothetical protein